MASPRHGKYPFVLVVRHRPFPVCSSSPGGWAGLGGPAAVLSLPLCQGAPGRARPAGSMLGSGAAEGQPRDVPNLI